MFIIDNLGHFSVPCVDVGIFQNGIRSFGGYYDAIGVTLLLRELSGGVGCLRCQPQD
jgi:hypothetical protein